MVKLRRFDVEVHDEYGNGEGFLTRVYVENGDCIDADEAVAEIERLRTMIREAAMKIISLPTWVESNSYEAQVDMRNRASAVVGNILVGTGEEVEHEIDRAVERLKVKRDERLGI